MGFLQRRKYEHLPPTTEGMNERLEAMMTQEQQLADYKCVSPG